MELIQLIKLVIVCYHLVTQLAQCYDFNLIFNAPDLTSDYIPRNVTKMCGQRFIRHPISIDFNKKCFRNSLDMQYLTEVFGNIDISKPGSRVLGGVDAHPNEAPWAVRLAKRYSVFHGKGRVYTHKCSGVLITLKHIITAKECLT